MTTEITTGQLERLPKYAKEYIRGLERERDQAVEKARRLTDSQTATKIYVEDYGAPENERREYVQGDTVVITNGGVSLRVSAYRDDRIDLSWSEGDRSYGTGEVAFIPSAHQQARLVSVDHLYTWPKIQRVKK